MASADSHRALEVTQLGLQASLERMGEGSGKLQRRSPWPTGASAIVGDNDAGDGCSPTASSSQIPETAWCKPVEFSQALL
jgi:hypothetical protein